MNVGENMNKIIYVLLIVILFLTGYFILSAKGKESRVSVDEIIFEVELTSNLKSIRDSYFEGAEKIHNLSLSIIQNDSFKNKVTNLKAYNEYVTLFYNRLLEIDKEFSSCLKIKNVYRDFSIDTSKEQFVQINRTFYIQNLEKLESEIMSIDNENKFRQTIKTALLAIIISVFGIILPIICKSKLIKKLASKLFKSDD